MNKVIELIKQEHVEAVFAFNDVLATIITKAIKAHGLDIEVVGYDSIHEQLPFVNDVTSIQFDFDALAELSVSSLLEIIENPETEIKQIKIPVKLHTKGDH
jgi:DNA-binding LacI/PurR family transcriptional regulator